MTLASLVMVAPMVTENTKAMIAMTIYRNMIIMALSPPMSSPVKRMAWFRYLGTKLSRDAS